MTTTHPDPATPGAPPAAAAPGALTGERADLIETLATHRWLLRRTAEGLSDEQARSAPTVSTLTVGGVVKHVSAMEEAWVLWALGEPNLVSAPFDDAGQAAHAETFVLGPDETLAGVLERYAAVAARTEAVVAGGIDLDAARPLPVAPWFPPGAVRTVRRTLLHVVAETAQHAGHADVIREAIDGQRTMG